MQTHAIRGPWAAGDRVLICIDESPGSASLVRYARRMADRLRAPWTALNIETVRSLRFSEEQRDRVAAALRLAEQLGGEAITIPGQNAPEEIVRYAEANNVTHIIIGKSTKSRLTELIYGSVTHSLIRLAGEISVHVVAPRDSEQASTKKPRTEAQKRSFDIVPFAWSTLLSRSPWPAGSFSLNSSMFRTLRWSSSLPCWRAP